MWVHLKEQKRIYIFSNSTHQGNEVPNITQPEYLGKSRKDFLVCLYFVCLPEIRGKIAGIEE